MKKSVVVLCTFCIFCFNIKANAAVFTAFDGDPLGFSAAITGSTSTSLDFEGLSEGSSLTNQFTVSDGITFSTLPLDKPFLTAESNIFGSNPVGNFSIKVPHNASSVSSFTWDFSNSVSFLGGVFIDNRFQINVELFDSSNMSLATFDISTTAENGDSAEWWGVVADDSVIAKAIFISGGVGDGIGFDNVTISAVPVPGAIWLFSSCLMSFFFTQKNTHKYHT